MNRTETLTPHEQPCVTFFFFTCAQNSEICPKQRKLTVGLWHEEDDCSPDKAGPNQEHIICPPPVSIIVDKSTQQGPETRPYKR